MTRIFAGFSREEVCMSVKWGVIGACGIADRRTIPEGIIPAENAQLVALMDIDEVRLKKVAEKYGGIRYYTKEDDYGKSSINLLVSTHGRGLASKVRAWRRRVTYRYGNPLY